MREATDEVHNGLAVAKVPSVFMREQMAVVNLALHSLAGIDDNSQETLEYIKQKDARAFKISMTTTKKSFRKLSSR